MVRLMRRFGPSAAVVMLTLLLLSPTAAAAAAPRLLGLPNLLPPIGTADSYTTPYQTELVVDAPGVLANDVDLDSPVLYTRFVSGPANGTLILETDGHFHYQPDPGFSGTDAFRYRPFDGSMQALLAVTVTIRVVAPIPTPTPKPTPTATPTPTPTPTLPPLPLPTPTLPPLPLPTPTPPLPMATPSPTPGATSPVVPTASRTPGPSGAPDPTSAPSGGPGPWSSPTGQPDPSPDTSAAPGVGGVVTGGGGPTAPGGLNLPPILAPQAGPISFGSFGGFGLGIEWIVPTAVFTLPGFLLLLIGLAQVFGGFLWLPIARRSMRGDGRPAPAGENWIPSA